MTDELTKLVDVISVLLLRFFEVDRFLGLAVTERELGEIPPEAIVRRNDDFREVKVFGDVGLWSGRLNLDGKTSRRQEPSS